MQLTFALYSCKIPQPLNSKVIMSQKITLGLVFLLRMNRVFKSIVIDIRFGYNSMYLQHIIDR